MVDPHLRARGRRRRAGRRAGARAGAPRARDGRDDAASRPTGASAASTRNSHAHLRRWPSARHRTTQRAHGAVATKSAPNWAASASDVDAASGAAPGAGRAARDGEHERGAERVRARCRRAATAARGGAAPRRRAPAPGRATRPAATQSGTMPGGSTKSIGTKTSCVGSARPLTTSNPTRETMAYTPTSSSARGTCVRPPPMIASAAVATEEQDRRRAQRRGRREPAWAAPRATAAPRWSSEGASAGADASVTVIASASIDICAPRLDGSGGVPLRFGDPVHSVGGYGGSAARSEFRPSPQRRGYSHFRRR